MTLGSNVQGCVVEITCMGKLHSFTGRVGLKSQSICVDVDEGADGANTVLHLHLG